MSMIIDFARDGSVHGPHGQATIELPKKND